MLRLANEYYCVGGVFSFFIDLYSKAYFMFISKDYQWFHYIVIIIIIICGSSCSSGNSRFISKKLYPKVYFMFISKNYDFTRLFYSMRVSIPALTGNFFPKYSRWSKQCRGLDGLNSSSHLLFTQSLFRAFGDRSKCPNYNWYHYHLYVPQVFQPSSKIQVFVYVFFSLVHLIHKMSSSFLC